MKFTINGLNWKIKETEVNKLVDIYNKTHDVKCIYAFGLCQYYDHIIYINKELENTQKKSTLYHELVHCWLWSHGVQFDKYEEEDICNFIFPLINDVQPIINKYFKEK